MIEDFEFEIEWLWNEIFGMELKQTQLVEIKKTSKSKHLSGKNIDKPLMNRSMIES